MIAFVLLTDVSSDQDGNVELLLGTDDQVVLAYKKKKEEVTALEPCSSSIPIEDRRHSIGSPPSEGEGETPPNDAADDIDELSRATGPLAVDPEINVQEDPLATAHSPSSSHPGAAISRSSTKSKPAACVSTWSPLSKAEWHLEAFGAIYSLSWLDVNKDGVNELLVASSTGVYIFEADALHVMKKLDALLSVARKP